MPDRTPSPYYVISLRPQGQHDALRRAVARLGGRVVALSPLRIAPRQAPALTGALAASTVVFTSPNAVAAVPADAWARLKSSSRVLATGSGTARALARRGIHAMAPSRMDSEGVLGMPGLQRVDGQAIGLVTGRGGRGLIESTLRERGARVDRADVYAREAASVTPKARARLHALDAPAVLALSSADALDAAMASLDGTTRSRLLRCAVVAASERLATHARDCGFRQVTLAASARPGDLAATCAEVARA